MAKNHQKSKPQLAYNSRYLALQVLCQVMIDKQSLNETLRAAKKSLEKSDAAFLQNLCYGVLRYYGGLSKIMSAYLKKELKAEDHDLKIVLILGLYQLICLELPSHAAVYETVELTRLLDKPWATGFVNGVLRQFLKTEKNPATCLGPVEENYPKWLVSELRSIWPSAAEQFLDLCQTQAPMSLRVNLSKTAREAYQDRLAQLEIEATVLEGLPSALVLKQALDIEYLPDFQSGYISVQDISAQLAAQFLAPQAQERVLDACAAPGGKSFHLKSLQPSIHLLSIELDPKRCDWMRLDQQRFGDQDPIVCADALLPKTWWDGQAFDRILLDAPCTGFGVMRRHPDLRWLRRPSDIKKLAALQSELLEALWPLLKTGGHFLYVTCSIWPEENQNNIDRFLKAHPEAILKPLQAPAVFNVAPATVGLQLMPNELSDGFYYALLEKR